MTDELKWERMRGVIQSVDLDKDDQLHITTDVGEWVFHPEGDCCAHAYIAEDEYENAFDGNVIGHRIVSASIDSGLSTGGTDANDAHDIDFYRIETEQGTATITLHTEHNGYYCGWLQCVSFTAVTA